MNTGSGQYENRKWTIWTPEVNNMNTGSGQYEHRKWTIWTPKVNNMNTESEQYEHRKWAIFFPLCERRIVQSRLWMHSPLPRNNSSNMFNATTVPTTWNKSGESTMTVSWEHTLSFDIIRYIFPAIVFSGTTGNILSAIVLMRRSMRSKSIYFYLFLLSIADTIVLYASAFKTWIRILTGFEMLHLSAASCKTFMFLLLFGQHMSAWLIVLVSLDRFVVVWFPFKSATFCNIRKARLMAVAITLVMMFCNSHVFWTIHLLPSFQNPNSTAPPSSFRCTPHEDDWFMNEAFNYVKFASYSFVPFFIVLVLNVGIIIR